MSHGKIYIEHQILASSLSRDHEASKILATTFLSLSFVYKKKASYCLEELLKVGMFVQTSGHCPPRQSKSINNAQPPGRASERSEKSMNKCKRLFSSTKKNQAGEQPNKIQKKTDEKTSKSNSKENDPKEECGFYLVPEKSWEKVPYDSEKEKDWGFVSSHLSKKA